MALITHHPPPVSLFVSGNNHEEIEFYILHSSLSPIILGHDWLVKHNPHIDWQNSLVMSLVLVLLFLVLSVLYFRLLLLISRGGRRNILICIRCPVKSEPPHYLLTDRTIALLSFSQALGFVIAAVEIRPDPAKVRAVADWAVPDTYSSYSNFWVLPTFTSDSSEILVRLLNPLPLLPPLKLITTEVMRLREPLMI